MATPPTFGTLLPGVTAEGDRKVTVTVTGSAAYDAAGDTFAAQAVGLSQINEMWVQSDTNFNNQGAIAVLNTGGDPTVVKLLIYVDGNEVSGDQSGKSWVVQFVGKS